MSDTELVTSTTVTQSYLAPGAAQESRADYVARKSVENDPVAETVAPVVLPQIATETPLANLQSRTNIVPDGPGTVADHLVDHYYQGS